MVCVTQTCFSSGDPLTEEWVLWMPKPSAPDHNMVGTAVVSCYAADLAEPYSHTYTHIYTDAYMHKLTRTPECLQTPEEKPVFGFC